MQVLVCDEGGDELTPLVTFSDWAVNGTPGGLGAGGHGDRHRRSTPRTTRRPPTCPRATPWR